MIVYPNPEHSWSGNLTYNVEGPLLPFECRQQPLPLSLPKIARSAPESLKMPWKKNHSGFWVKPGGWIAPYPMLRLQTTSTWPPGPA